MSIDTLLIIIGIIVALYALARPVQQKTIFIFASSFMVLSFLALSLLNFIILDIAYTYQIEISFKKSFWIRLISLILAISAALLVIVSWRRARLSLKRDRKFRAFIKVCVLENEYSELSRIISKNEAKLIRRVKSETLQLLFDRSFIKFESSINSHLHLRLLSNKAIFDTLSNPLGIVDLLAREMLTANNSLLKLAVVHEYGVEEHLRPDNEEWKLIEKTIQNPGWYMRARFDYPLIMAVVEKISSGEYDAIYNRYNGLYSISQGKSLRINCPIYLTLKTHVLMLKKAIDQNGNDDYYVSDLFDLLRMICDHSEYDRDNWKEYESSGYKPTTFAYLMDDINNDFADLFYHMVLYHQSDENLGAVGVQLSFIWPFCVLYIAESRDRVPEKFKKRFILAYLVNILKLKEHKDSWGNKLAEDMKDKLRLSNASVFSLFRAAHADLDLGKAYIFNHRRWLLGEIEEAEAGGRAAPSA